jgi:hypothetical protein
MVESQDMLGCVNLQSEQSIDSHNGLLSVLTAIVTIISKLTDSALKLVFESRIFQFPQTGDDAEYLNEIESNQLRTDA